MLHIAMLMLKQSVGWITDSDIFRNLYFKNDFQQFVSF